MPVWPSDYIEKVVKDVEKYNGIRKIVKASLIERFTVKFCPIDHIHPNPEDEFSQENVGPNMEIISDYIELVKFDQYSDQPVFREPLIVQKMEPDGYMLLNGHHRWFAAVRMNVKKIHIKIVNVINELDINRMVKETSNTKLATFDFDEVLVSSDEDNQEKIVNALFSNKYTHRLRNGAREVIKAFKDNGDDICVYSSSYLSEEEFNDFFSMYDLSVDVIVNGVNEKRSNASDVKSLLKEKYTQIVHVDNESVIYSYHITKDYDIFDIDKSNESWSVGVIRIINNNTNVLS